MPLADRRHDCSAQETWWALEDLWLRLAMHRRVTVETEDNGCCILVADFRKEDEAVAALRPHVLDERTYRWHGDGSRGSFVPLLRYRGDDLVFTLITLRAIEAWPGGIDLVGQVRAFLLRLQRMTCDDRTRNPAISASARRA
jgi:hypothetical protein